MNYLQLLNLLQGLENRFRGNSTHLPANFTGSNHVRLPPATNACEVRDGNVQHFALDHSTHDLGDLPVVVALGVNYTQGKQSLPHRHTRRMAVGHPWVEDELDSRFRDRLDKFVKCYATDSPRWKQAERTSSPGFIYSLPTKYHLVLTNLTPWITDVKWSDSSLDRTDKNGLFNNPPTGSGWRNGVPVHVTDLQADLVKSSASATLWIGHTIDCETELRRCLTGIGINPWLITANLATHWSWPFCR